MEPTTQPTYLVGMYRNPAIEAAVLSGTHPRPEYAVFATRHQTPLLTYDDVRDSRGPITSYLLRRRQAHWALGAFALRRARGAPLITSGDDVWVSLLIQCAIGRSAQPSYNLAHGSFFASKKFRLLVRRFKRMPRAHLLTLSESLRRIAVCDLGFPAERAINAGYGVDLDFFRASDEPDREPLIAAAGTANRDYSTLVEAVRPLNVRVSIAADSAWFPQALDVPIDRLPPNVDARSHGDYLGLRKLYNRALCVVVPLYPARNACGYAVIAEAMAMGRPVITTRIEAHSDFVVDGETGFYVKPGDPGDLREKLMCLVEDPGLARDMGAAARARMEQHYSVEAYCDRIATAVGLNSVRSQRVTTT